MDLTQSEDENIFPKPKSDFNLREYKKILSLVVETHEENWKGTPTQKGDVLEDLCDYLFSHFSPNPYYVQAFQRCDDTGTKFEQIDGVINFHCNKGVFGRLNKDIFIEAKNRNKKTGKVDTNDMASFYVKMGKRHLEYGILVSFSGYKSTCAQQQKELFMTYNCKILLFKLSDLEKIAEGIRPSKILQEKIDDCMKMKIKF